MIIDFHVHTFPDKIAASAIQKLKSMSHTVNFTDGTIKTLAESMNEAGVNISVLQPVATKPEQVKSINDKAIKINSESKITGIISFGAMHPDFESPDEELERIKNFGIKGIKLHPLYQETNINDEKYMKILRYAGDKGLSVLIHAGYDIGFPKLENALPEKILKAVKESPHTKIILAHMGGWKSWDEAEKLFADIENVYIDTAFSLGRFTPENDGYYKNSDECEMLSAEKFLRMIKNFGSERVIFGTDSPWASQSESVKDFNSLALNQNEKENIFFKNALKLIQDPEKV